MVKKLSIAWYGYIEKDKLILEKESMFKEFLTNLKRPNEEKTKVVLSLKRYYKTRSVRANSYYWVCLTHIAHELGYEPDELHSTFKAMFLIDRSGKLPIVRSTTSLDTTEFMDYISKIAAKVGELGILLPSPEDYYQN